MAYTFKHGDRPLDDYTIQRAIGRGGFGEVYYAMSDGGREVALKYLKENPAVELRGVSHCINLKSPYLVSIFDVKKNGDGDYFIIMEYCSGPSLRDLMIAEPRGFAPEKAAFFTREIAKGLSYLHDRGIVHRDLKPGNIFFDDGYVKIGDYGLSKFISVSRHSAQTASVGTVHYMAPEIGSGNYSRGVDIYALGVMLYEMLLGKVPFEGSSMAEVLMKHLTAQPELDVLPAQFGKVIRKALQKDPNDRYQTAEEMLDDLLSGEEIQQSLAGFSTKSLEGAVRVGGRDRLDSPIPSPNPPPRSPGGFVFKADIGRGAPDGAPLPDRLARKMERITRKIDRKIARLGAKRGGHGPDKLPSRAESNEAASPQTQPTAEKSDRAKRLLLLFLLLAGVSVGLGVTVGNTYGGLHGGQVGAGAGLLVAGLYFGAVLGRRMVRWFDVQHGPGWAGKLILACSAAPFLAIGCAPLFDLGIGLPVWLALITLAAFKCRDVDYDSPGDGEIRFGPIFGNAITALIFTAIIGGITDIDPENVMFISAGAAAGATFVLQAGAWWSVHHRTAVAGAARNDHGDRRHGEAVGSTEPPPPPVRSHVRTATQAENAAQADWRRSWESTPHQGGASQSAAPFDPFAPRPRAMVARMFWSVVAFSLMGVAVVTFLIPLLSRGIDYHDLTAVIIACVGSTALMLFALRKTTAFRRVGFWRDTARPFFISMTLFGIGGTTTGIAREFNHCEEYGECPEWRSESVVTEHAQVIARVEKAIQRATDALPDAVAVHMAPPIPPVPGMECIRYSLGDEERVALIAGLVMSSIMFLVLSLFTGGKTRPPRPPRSFLQGGDGGRLTSDEPPSLRGGVAEVAANADACCDSCEAVVIPIKLSARPG